MPQLDQSRWKAWTTYNETINLLHKTKHGKPVDESYRNIKAAEIREIIRDMGWDKESKPKEKKRKEAKTVSKGSHKGQKKKITHETSPATSDSESEGTERASTSQKKPKKKRTHETSYESEGAERASTPENLQLGSKYYSTLMYAVQ